MSVLSTARHRVAAGAIALTVAAGGGAAAVVTSWPSSTAAPTGSPVISLAANGQTSPPGAPGAAPGASITHHHRATIREILARTDHAVFTVKFKGSWVTLTFDRGTVTAISPTAVTVQRPDGGVATLAINSTTKIGRKLPATSIPTGSRVVVLSENGVALRIVEMKPGPPAGSPAPVNPSTPATAA